VEYVVWDKVADLAWKLKQYSFFKNVAVFGGIVIYQFFLKDEVR